MSGSLGYTITMSKQRVNVRAIIWLDGKLLLVKHKRDNNEVSPYYATPGGGLDPFESLQDGVVREVREEMGIEAKVGRLLFIQQFRSKRAGFEEELEFFFHIENPEDFVNIDLESTTHGKHELALCEFVDLSTTDLVLPRFIQAVDIDKHIKTNAPTAIFSLFNKH